MVRLTTTGLLFFFDLSARRQLQKELAIRESNLHALAEAIPQLLWVLLALMAWLPMAMADSSTLLV
jgi:hypothetical protein